MAILNRFSAILQYCDSTHFFTSLCGISGDSRRVHFRVSIFVSTFVGESVGQILLSSVLSRSLSLSLFLSLKFCAESNLGSKVGGSDHMRHRKKEQKLSAIQGIISSGLFLSFSCVFLLFLKVFSCSSDNDIPAKSGETPAIISDGEIA